MPDDDVKEYRNLLRLMLALMQGGNADPTQAARLVRREGFLAAVIGQERANQIFHEIAREIRRGGKCPICGVSPPCGEYGVPQDHRRWSEIAAPQERDGQTEAPV